MRAPLSPTSVTPTSDRRSISRLLWLPVALLALFGLMALRTSEPISMGPLPACTSQVSYDTGSASAGIEPHVTLVVFDASGSVIDSGGADPDGRSFEEARILADALAEQPCTSEDRMGALVFASTAVEVPPIPLSSLSVIKSAITRPPENEIGGGTNLSGALEKVQDIVGRYPGHVITVVLLSDMQVGDPQVVEDHLLDLSEHSLHLVALGNADRSFDDAFTTVAALDHVDRGDVAKALAEAVRETRKEAKE